MKLWFLLAVQVVIIAGIWAADPVAKASNLGVFQKDYEELLDIYKNIPNMSQDEIIAAYEKVSGALDRLEVMNKRLGAMGNARKEKLTE